MNIIKYSVFPLLNTPFDINRRLGQGALKLYLSAKHCNMGLIAVEGMQFYSHHGYYKEEQVLGGKYIVDVYMEVNFSEAAETDDLDKTINYEDIYQQVRAEMEQHARLIEHVCKRIIDSIKVRYPTLKKLKVRVSKHNPPLKGNVERVFVELDA